MRIRSSRTATIALAASSLLGGSPLWAVSLAAIGPSQPIPESITPGDMTRGSPRDSLSPTELAAADIGAAGSTTLVPLMATDVQARPIAVSAVDSPTNGGAPVGKPVDDMQFVKQAIESGRKEIHAAQEALPQIKDPELRHVAEMLVNDHGGANERLAQLAEAKGWPAPGPAAPGSAPPSGTASSDFDARFTAEMIAGHERSVALYRAQATGGEDKDLRRYAKDTLPTIEKHLAELRRLQK